MAGAAWRNEAGTCRFSCGPLAGELDPSNPSTGLRELSLSSVQLTGCLLAAKPQAGVLAASAESYVRGADHVSTHPATSDFPFRTQLYWSGKSLSGGAVAATLAVSLQTDLLDTEPQLDLVTTLAGASPAVVKNGYATFALPTGGVLVVTPYPSDAAECSLRREGDSLALRLAPPFLEKGVIRRVRVAAVVLPGAEALEAALADLADDPLPLTT